MKNNILKSRAQGDTIAAISTPRGRGGVALLRVSGEDAVDVASRVFSTVSGKDLGDVESRCAVYGSIHTPDGEDIDDGICTVFRAPASFTGEDTVEICCHGGILVTENVLSALLMAGARQAEAGEFTRRAYVNGKMTLTSAEALGNLLDAKSEEQLSLSRGGYTDKLSNAADKLYLDMCEVLSNLEAGMDFPEEDLTELSRGEMYRKLSLVAHKTDKLLATYRTGHAIAEGIHTVICGKPNVGKSSLYNALVGRDAAIVTDIAGTTRDVLSESITLGGVTLRLFDTAGLHDTTDAVESIGVDRARMEVDRAELVLALFDGSNILDGDDEKLIDYLKSKKVTVIYVITKSDISKDNFDISKLAEGAICVNISSTTGDGIDTLAETVRRLYIDENIKTNEDAVLFSVRQNVALAESRRYLAETLERLSDDIYYDICAESLHSAMHSLAELCGREVREDVISEIFSKFCVGK